MFTLIILGDLAWDGDIPDMAGVMVITGDTLDMAGATAEATGDILVTGVQDMAGVTAQVIMEDITEEDIIMADQDIAIEIMLIIPEEEEPDLITMAELILPRDQIHPEIITLQTEITAPTGQVLLQIEEAVM